MPTAAPCRRVLLIISGDPRASHRPAEALRLAAGLLPWGQIDLQVCLCGPARWLLDDAPGTLVDEEEITRCLSAVTGEPGRLWVEAARSPGAEPSETAGNVRTMSREQIATLAARCDSVLKF